MLSVFAEDPEDQRIGPDSLHPSKQWQDLCPMYYALPKEVRGTIGYFDSLWDVVSIRFDSNCRHLYCM
ncbi:hypothetical protein Clacol_000405 [Clathrus columnatus]|uniref:Uncharacterized protein n=1 Tax=Clathrus columnatus TaxID=1419009 RepID=A0AAV4ZZN9_9AGAM|nr:hypothetical protein Clacol_000405 [Clathrus columnatus]